MSASCNTIGCVSTSIAVFAATALTVSMANTADDLVIVSVIVSALPESLATRIDLSIAVVGDTLGIAESLDVGTVYTVVAFVVVRSTAFDKNRSAKIPTPC